MKPYIGLQLLLASLVLPSFAEETRELSGEALPKYYVVREFLYNGISAYKNSSADGTSPQFHQFLGNLGLSHGTNDEEIAVQALLNASIELERKTVDHTLSARRTEFRDHQATQLKLQARRLGEIYGEFLAGYLESGMPAPVIQALDETIDLENRPNISVYSFGEPNSALRTLEQDFREGVELFYETDYLTGWGDPPNGEHK